MNGLDLTSMISLLAVCVTFFVGIAGLIVNSFIQRKSNSISVITQTRLKRRKDTQRIAAELLKYSDLDYLKSFGKDNSERTLLKKKIIECMAKDVAELRALYSFSFDKDAKLIKAAEKLKESVAIYINAKKKHAKKEVELIDARRNFEMIVDVYLSTEWKRIKLETVGKEWKKNSLGKWEDQYNHYENGYKSVYKENFGNNED